MVLVRRVSKIVSSTPGIQKWKKKTRCKLLSYNGLLPGWERGLEPPASRSTICDPPAVSEAGKGLTPTLSAACTAACTSEAEIANADTLNANQDSEGEGIDQGDPLAILAAALLSLSPTDRERLAAMLTGPRVERRVD